MNEYPHEKIQGTVIELLISALELSELHEQKDGKDQRQEALTDLISSYLDTVEAIQAGQARPVAQP